MLHGCVVPDLSAVFLCFHAAVGSLRPETAAGFLLRFSYTQMDSVYSLDLLPRQMGEIDFT